MQKFTIAALAATLFVPAFAPPLQADTIAHSSYYGRELAGRKTASGERFNPGAMTAAHRSLPFGTRLRLTNLRNGRTIIVRINDRGPFVRGRSLDVSQGAASALGFVGQGTARLRMEAMGHGVLPTPSESRSDSPPPRMAQGDDVDWRSVHAEEALRNN
jgi:rare lipoprotein A